MPANTIDAELLAMGIPMGTDYFTIHQNEPEGWEKAFEVRNRGQHVAWFTFHDSARRYVRDRQEAQS